MRTPRTGWLAAACLLAAACQLPTDPPIIEQRWILPLEVVTLGAAELLPDDNSVTDNGSSYDVSVDPVTASESLGNLCTACIALNGLTWDTPPFSGSFTTSTDLPQDVQAVEVQSGSIDITITNGLSFDPIAAGGSITVTVANAGGGDVLGTLVLDGATESVPAGAVLNRTLSLGAGTIDGPIETTVDVVHTGGQNTTIDTSELLSANAVTTSLQVSEATIDVDGYTATLTEEPLDADDLDDTIIESIQSGSVSMTVTNPFDIVFDGSITLGGITKTLSVGQAASSTVEIAFTGAELRAILSLPGATFSGSGTLSGGPAVVTPGLSLDIEPTIDVTLEIGG